MSEAFTEAVIKVFRCAIVDAHHAARRDDKAARAKFTAVLDALEAAYPREIRPILADDTTSDALPAIG